MEKEIKGFPNYRIDRNGNVFSNYKFKTAIPCDTWRPVKHVLDKGVGYYLVTLVVNGKKRNCFIHRLLAQAFIPNPENKAHVNHIDGIKTNNSLSNLEWNTPKENSQHAQRLGLCDKGRKAQEKIIIQLDDDFNFIAEHPSIHAAGRATNAAWQNISKVVLGKRSRAGGFRWKYK